jgi:hypothetical protein
MDFLSFAADGIKDSVEFRVFEVYFLDSALA